MYINTNTQEYPVSEHEIQKQFPNLIFPPSGIPNEYLAQTVFAHVLPTPPPSVSHPKDNVQEGAPEFVAGAWKQKWEVVPYTGPSDDEIEARQQAREAAVAELKGSPPPNTLPQLIARVDLIETLLGLK